MNVFYFELLCISYCDLWRDYLIFETIATWQTFHKVSHEEQQSVDYHHGGFESSIRRGLK